MGHEGLAQQVHRVLGARAQLVHERRERGRPRRANVHVPRLDRLVGDEHLDEVVVEGL